MTIDHQPPLILVVDDTTDLRELYGLMLEHVGYRVVTAPNGKAGLELATELRPALVLLDMMMPEMGGLEFLDELPKVVPEPPPVIAMSGFDEFEKEALARGARAFLLKPLGANDLFGTVDAVLSGLRVDAAALSAHTGRIASKRKRNAELRKALLARVDLNEPTLQNTLRALVQWCTGYFDVGMAFVNVLRDGKIHLQACAGAGEFAEGNEIDRELSFCTLVIDAALPMVLGDASASTVFSKHPAVVAGFRFYAGVPLRTPDDVVFGTLCLVDREPHSFFSEDLSVMEALADGVSRRVQTLAGEQVHEPLAFVTPGVFARDMLHILVDANLRRVARNRGTIELAHIDLGAADVATYRACADAVYDALARHWVGVAEYGHGVLAVIVGAATSGAARERMNAALGAARKTSRRVRGIGVVGYQADTARLIDARTLEAIADEARMAAVASGGVRRIEVHAESPGVAPALQPSPSASAR
jgi:CheY-like chemotaxis protein